MSGAESEQNTPEQPPKKKGPSSGAYFKIFGYILTAGWIGFVLAASGGESSHPLFDYIFVVPLAGWIIGMLIARFIAKKSESNLS